MKQILIFGLILVQVALIHTTMLGFPTIDFQYQSHDFGTIKEADGPVNHVFTFTNNGTETLLLHNVKAS